MACKLYYKHGTITVPIGTFKSREQAEEFWKCIHYNLAIRHGKVEPIYVETGKGRK